MTHDLRSGDEVGAAVDVDESACHAPRERRRQVDAGMADVHDVDQLSEGRLVRGLVEEQLEVLDARRRPCLQRTRRDGVDADALRSEFVGQIATGRLQALTGPMTL